MMSNYQSGAVRRRGRDGERHALTLASHLTDRDRRIALTAMTTAS
jgi:hypothetical protein